MRDISIAQRLINDECVKENQIGFVCRKDGPFKRGFDLLKSAGMNVLDIPDSELEWDSIAEASVMLSQNVKLVIVDRLSTSDVWMRKLRSGKARVISFDDTGDGAIYSDVLINGILHDFIEREDRYVGYEYLYLNQLSIAGNRIIRTKITSIVVTFGGYDSRDLTGFFLDSLSSSARILGSSVSIELLVSNESDQVMVSWRNKIDQFLASDMCNVDLFVRPNDFYERLSNADLAVVSGGLTVFQALAMGVPVIGLPQYEHKNKTLQYLSQKCSLTLGSDSMILDSCLFFNRFINLFESSSLRLKQSEKGQKLIDGFGNNRVIEIISKEIRDCYES
jgi:spore coat polysaccharide biosynthesis predicted glycosyltransferase SpsG